MEKRACYAPKIMSIVQQERAETFDLFRLSKSKVAVDAAPNTVRSYFKQGLNFYKRGKAIYVSRAEFRAFIMGSPRPASAAPTKKSKAIAA
jgi:hypothetical protein